MKGEVDQRWYILGGFALVAAVIVAVILLSRAGGGEDSEASSCEKPAGPVASSAKKSKPTVEVPDCPAPEALVANDLERGTGATAKSGDKVSVQYVGINFGDGKEFDSSWSRGAEPFTFTLGGGEVIPGWDQGVEGMKVGGRRELIIPPDLAYGEAGSPPTIGPNETLVFVVDLEAVK